VVVQLIICCVAACRLLVLQVCRIGSNHTCNSLSHGSWVILIRAESVTETGTEYRDILKNETETDIGIEKTEKYRKPKKKNENSVFADDDIYYLNYEFFAVKVKK